MTAGILLGINWLLSHFFVVPPGYTLSALLIIPPIGLTLLWIWPITVALFAMTGDVSEAQGGYSAAVRSYTALAVLGVLFGVGRWLFATDSLIVLSILGGVIGLLMGMGAAALMKSGWLVLGGIFWGIVAADATFLTLGPPPWPQADMSQFFAFFIQDGAPIPLRILAVPVGIGAFLGLLLPPALPQPQPVPQPQFQPTPRSQPQPPAPAPGLGTSTEVARQAQLREILNRQRKH